MRFGRAMPFWSVVALVVAGRASFARADAGQIEACIAAAERGQELFKEGHVRAASDHFSKCVRAGCPAAVQRDCVRFAAEADAAVATLAVKVVDENGSIVKDARVSVDGIAVESPDGKPLLLDPGSHVIEGSAGSARASSTVRLVTGERGRSVELRIRAEKANETASTTHRPIPSEVWIAGGVGLAGVITFGVMGALGASEVDDVRARCAPRCADDALGPATTKLVIGDVALLAGIVALSVATWLYIKRPAAVVSGAAGTSWTF